MSNTISPQDLRLGNLILRRAADLETGKYFYEPIQVDIDDIKLLAIRQDQDIYRPIPLTEEILVKCGFIKSATDPDNPWLTLKIGYLIFDSDYSVNFSKVFVSIGRKQIEIDYLHQLQNAYYFLMSGRELEIKL